MNDNAAPSFYAVTYAELRQVAKQHGYALALHGSLQRDLDVVAVPWLESPSNESVLVAALAEAAGGFIVPNEKGERSYSLKPHGRHAWVIHFGGCSAIIPPEQRATYIDLSVMPCVV